MDEFDFENLIDENERAQMRAQRLERRKERQRRRRAERLKLLIPAAGVLAALVLVFALRGLVKSLPPKAPREEERPAAVETAAAEEPAEEPAEESPEEAEPEEEQKAAESSRTVTLPEEETDSRYAVVIDAQSGEILAERGADARISPASMTKVLSLLVAVEHIGDLDQTCAIDRTITDYCYLNDCSVAGFEIGETVPLRDMLYGTILPSGADAVVELAVQSAGSHEAFVEWMNEKLAELGLSETAHFTNCVGLYDENHYCTVTDMAMIMKAAMNNDLCRQVLGARTYSTTHTKAHPEGLALSNWFLRRIEDRFVSDPLDIIGGKTGYVKEAGSCAASCALRRDGRMFLCVTAMAGSSWRAIYDHTALYQTYCES